MGERGDREARLTGPAFPFGPGTAREVRDPAAEAARLARAHAASGTVTVPRRDFAVLVALASLGAAHYAEGDAGQLPEGVSVNEAAAVLGRYAAY